VVEVFAYWDTTVPDTDPSSPGTVFATLANMKLDVRLSVGRTGSCHDNAVAEAFFAALKNEFYHRHTFATKARARSAVAEWIEVFYNRQRRHSTLDYRTPVAAMADHFTITAVPEQIAA
jgi:transposase InsO family protein